MKKRRIPGLKTARNLARRLQDRVLGGALILGYHRVFSPDRDEYDMCVSPAHFAEQLEVLSRRYHPITMEELSRLLEQGALPRGTVAVTFDDGYADNLTHALPLLEQRQVPATVFATAGCLGSGFWWYELKRLLSSPALPGPLLIEIQDEAFMWKAARSEANPDGLDEAAFARQLNALQLRLLRLPGEDRARVMAFLRSQTGSLEPAGMEGRALTPEELTALARSPLVAIGSHTTTHPDLSLLPLDRQKEEVVQSKAFLEGTTGKPVVGFSYPNGRATGDTRRLVQDAGYRYACGSHQELARGRKQAFYLPRFWPKDWDGDQFAHRLKSWLGS